MATKAIAKQTETKKETPAEVTRLTLDALLESDTVMPEVKATIEYLIPEAQRRAHRKQVDFVDTAVIEVEDSIMYHFLYETLKQSDKVAISGAKDPASEAKRKRLTEIVEDLLGVSYGFFSIRTMKGAVYVRELGLGKLEDGKVVFTFPEEVKTIEMPNGKNIEYPAFLDKVFKTITASQLKNGSMPGIRETMSITYGNYNEKVAKEMKAVQDATAPKVIEKDYFVHAVVDEVKQKPGSNDIERTGKKVVILKPVDGQGEDREVSVKPEKVATDYQIGKVFSQTYQPVKGSKPIKVGALRKGKDVEYNSQTNHIRTGLINLPMYLKGLKEGNRYFQPLTREELEGARDDINAIIAQMEAPSPEAKKKPARTTTKRKTTAKK